MLWVFFVIINLIGNTIMKNKAFFLTLAMLTTLFISGCNPSEVTFTLNEPGEVDIHTDEQNAFWNDQDMEKSLLQYGSGEENKEKPNPVKLSWKVTRAKFYTVNVSENEDMSDAWHLESKKKEYDLYNCKTGTKYYWTVTAHYSSVEHTSQVGTFTIKAGGPRNIYIDGVNNVRDIGGYVTNGGKTIKQGLIYRTAKMNESSVAAPQMTITENGIKTATEQLKIKTDIDLRKVEKDSSGVDEIGGITKSPLGESVNYVNCPMYYDGSSVIAHTTSAKDAANKENIKKMFDVLAVKDNYPVAFHCTQGKDRTGALAYLMETLLDMKTTDIYHDYLFTNMSQIGGYCAYKAFAGYDYYLNQQEGSNLSQKAYNYLLSIGVSATNIDSFISIMTE